MKLRFSLWQLMVVMFYIAVTFGLARYSTTHWYDNEACLMIFSLFYIILLVPLILMIMIRRKNKNSPD